MKVEPKKLLNQKGKSSSQPPFFVGSRSQMFHWEPMDETSDSCYDSASKIVAPLGHSSDPPRGDVSTCKSGGQESTREMWNFRGFISSLHIITGWWISIYMYTYMYIKFEKTKSQKKINHQNTQKSERYKKNHPYLNKKTPFLHPKKRNNLPHILHFSPNPLQPYLGLIWRNIHQNHYLESGVSCTKMLYSTILPVDTLEKCWYPCDGAWNDGPFLVHSLEN